MKIKIPSFRSQIITLTILVLAVSVLFYRFYFMSSYTQYKQNVATLEIDQELSALYQNYSSSMSPEDSLRYQKDIEKLLRNEKQREMAGIFFEEDIALYSIFIFVFLIIIMLVISFISFNLITRPLVRLQAATHELIRGNWDIHLPESKFSPLNDLILSFNSMAREIARSQEKLIQAEKDVVWREMARVMAHEIKNPLTPILLTVERLEYKYKTAPDTVHELIPRSIEVIKEEIANLKKLTVSFSQFAKLPDLEFANFKLNKLLREVIIPYEEKADIQLDLDPEVDKIYGDRFQFKVVIVNLIQNAIQACDNNPEIIISTKDTPQTVFIRIRDNGKGIPPDDVEKIFEPYYSKKKKGTGLGLAIVRKIVEQHSGTISVESSGTEGTVFVLAMRKHIETGLVADGSTDKGD
ncbi:MAG: HAMP domain-containing histidine kinase [FCB group bacterium]|nr:HAMP domain-containing histidine kinase [FCB group bacterium]